MADHARSMAMLAMLLVVVALLAAGSTRAAPKGESPPKIDAPADSSAARRYTTETVRGKVMWVEEALSLIGVAADPAAAEQSVVLRTPQGTLVPLVPDVRGHAFAVDERLRQVDLELLVRKYDAAPMVQVIRVFKRKPDGLYEVDYWCDICAIPMFTLKPCECCQGETRLRERRVEDQPEAPER
jgi:hypothetical protein